MAKKGKEAKRKEKKQRTGKKHLSLKPHEYYEVSGDSVTRKNKHCPRCGPGTWLGGHKGRLYCGKCGYTEFEKRPPSGDRPSEQPSQPREERPPEQPAEKAETPPEDTQIPKGAQAPSGAQEGTSKKPEESK